jgi:hypothetical protein
LKDTSPPTIAPTIAADNAMHGLLQLPSRDQFGSARLLRKGRRTKADLLLLETTAGRIVIKDFGRKAWWVRQTGRIMVRRETRAYERLASMAGLPRAIGRVDAYALALEYLDATELAFSPQRKVDGVQKLGQLQAIVDGLHLRGVAHCDLRSRDNLLVDSAGQLYVVDLAGAICLRPGSLLHRLFFRWIALIDRSACLKWKQILEAGPMTGDEQAFANRFRLLRRFWFHRRQAWRGKTRPPA